MGNLRIIGLVIVGLTFFSCEKDFNDNENDVFINSVEKTSTQQRKKDDKTHKIDICHKSDKIINVAIPAAFSHLENGGKLFSCDPIYAVTYEDLKGFLKIKVFEQGGNFNDPVELESAFEDWYINDYLTGDWLIEEDNGNSSGGGTGSGGIGGGSL